MGVMYTSLCDHSRRSISISISISRKWVDVEAESETRLISESQTPCNVIYNVAWPSNPVR